MDLLQRFIGAVTGSKKAAKAVQKNKTNEPSLQGMFRGANPAPMYEDGSQGFPQAAPENVPFGFPVPGGANPQLFEDKSYMLPKAQPLNFPSPPPGYNFFEDNTFTPPPRRKNR